MLNYEETLELRNNVNRLSSRTTYLPKYYVSAGEVFRPTPYYALQLNLVNTTSLREESSVVLIVSCRFIDAHTAAQNLYTEKNVIIFTLFVMASCYVQKR
jgi:hypothetical protein